MRDTTSRLRTRLHAAPPRIYRHEPARPSSRLQWRLSLWIEWEWPTMAIRYAPVMRGFVATQSCPSKGHWLQSVPNVEMRQCDHGHSASALQ
ncbi:hypothetical protein IG631_08245 [Alternaria alternata]|nr:hypothetical protein IG631_08245 [Alternaria alternata]